LWIGVAPATALEGFAWRRFVVEGDGAVDADGDIDVEGELDVDRDDVEDDVDVDRDDVDGGMDVEVDEPPARDAPPSRAPAGSEPLDTPPLPSESVPWPEVGTCDALDVDVRGAEASEVFDGRPEPDEPDVGEPDVGELEPALMPDGEPAACGSASDDTSCGRPEVVPAIVGG
jgi:hypothetical protein